jgi:hypothetical protein
MSGSLCDVVSAYIEAVVWLVTWWVGGRRKIR